MAFHMGRVSGKHLVTLMCSSSFPPYSWTLLPPLSLCQISQGWMLSPRLALKAPCSMTSYCGFLQPATHPLPCWTSHPFPHPQGFGCALMQLLLPWSKQVLCVFASKPSSVQEHHLVCEGKGFLLPSFHLQCAFLSTAL